MINNYLDSFLILNVYIENESFINNLLLKVIILFLIFKDYIRNKNLTNILIIGL